MTSLPTRALSHDVIRHNSHRVCFASECRPDGVSLSHLHPACSVTTNTAMTDTAEISVSDTTDSIIEKLGTASAIAYAALRNPGKTPVSAVLLENAIGKANPIVAQQIRTICADRTTSAQPPPHSIFRPCGNDGKSRIPVVVKRGPNDLDPIVAYNANTATEKRKHAVPVAFGILLLVHSKLGDDIT